MSDNRSDHRSGEQRVDGDPGPGGDQKRADLDDGSDVVIEVVDPQSEAALLAMGQYFTELDERFPTGFDPGDTLDVDAPGFRPPVGVFLLGLAGGTADDPATVVACGGVQLLDDGAAEIKRMWVSADRRGRGLGKRMLGELESHAARLGNGIVRLDTNSVLVAAIRMYERAGYREIPRYNDNPFAKHWFERSLDT